MENTLTEILAAWQAHALQHNTQASAFDAAVKARHTAKEYEQMVAFGMPDERIATLCKTLAHLVHSAAKVGITVEDITAQMRREATRQRQLLATHAIKQRQREDRAA